MTENTSGDAGAPNVVRIGVVNAPALIDALASLNFTVITGDGFRAAATAVSNTLRVDKFPVIVADGDDAVLAQWAAACALRADGMVALGVDGGRNLFADGPGIRLELPATFNDLLAALGYAGTSAPIGSYVIERSGALTEPVVSVAPLGDFSQAEVTVDADPFDDLDSILAAAAPAAEIEVPADDPIARVEAFGVPAAEEAPAEVVAPAPVFTSTEPSPADIFAEPEDILDEPADTLDEAQIPDPVAHSVASPPLPSPVFGAPQPEPVAEVTDEPAEERLPAEPQPVELFAAPPIAPLSLPGGIPGLGALEASLPAASAADQAPSPAVSAPVFVPTVLPAAAAVPVVMPVAVAPVLVPAAVVTSEPAPAATPLGRAERPTSVPPRGTKHGEVIFTAAGKGGVGKTTTALGLTATAADAGLQAILIDANRGQADVRKYLRLGAGELRTIYDAYAAGDPAHAFLMPRDHTPARKAAALEPLDFGIVLGPPAELSDPRHITPALYGDVIDYARSIADLVVVDTQIVEAPSNRTDLWNQTVIPMLSGDAWLVAITDDSPGVENLLERLGELRRDGVQPARTLVLASQYLDFGRVEVDYFQREFGELGEFIGNTGLDDDFAAQLNTGRINIDSTAMRPALDSILLRATGMDDRFNAQRARPERAAKAPAKFSLFGKKKRA